MGMTGIITGLCRGATRRVMSAKQGNKNFYKGTGSGRMGRWTARGRFILEPWRFRSWEIPDLSTCELKPYVSKNADKYLRRAHTFRDYFRPKNIPEDMDPVLADRCRIRASQAHNRITGAKP
ncbi:hypothetical protein SpCBS45565_g06951 [Spizellomyces sp. 'palustris']|nr:hypothetical protein SpCBS45565_g06951 [Spizellomyces sp. 'palustris']